MAGGTWQLTNTTRIKLLNGQFDLDSDSFKAALVTSASNIGPTSTTWAGVTGEVGTTNTGYSTGGQAVSLVLSGTTSVTVKFSANPVWTAGTANLTAKTVVLYEVGGDVVGYCNLDAGGADVTATSGNTMTADAITNPIFTLA